MKKREWILIGGVAIIAAVISLLVSDSIFGSPKKHPILVPEVEKISSDFPKPQTDDQYKTFYNQEAFNPTQIIKIGGQGNTEPFKSADSQ